MATPGKFDINPATGKAYGFNPATNSMDDNYWALKVEPQLKAGGGASTTTNALQDPIALAKQAQQMQIDANQPAIQGLTSQKSTLDQKYDDLLKSIDSSQQPALDATVKAQNSELARRGITGDSGIAQNTIAAAQVPIAAQFGQLKANTGIQREQDLTGLASTIAGLQAGNVPSALNFSSGIGNLQNQAQQIANTFTLGSQQNALAAQQARYIPAGYGGLLDTTNGSVVAGPKSIGAGGIYDPITGQVISGIKAQQNSVNNNTGW